MLTLAALSAADQAQIIVAVLTLLGFLIHAGFAFRWAGRTTQKLTHFEKSSGQESERLNKSVDDLRSEGKEQRDRSAAEHQKRIEHLERTLESRIERVEKLLNDSISRVSQSNDKELRRLRDEMKESAARHREDVESRDAYQLAKVNTALAEHTKDGIAQARTLVDERYKSALDALRADIRASEASVTERLQKELDRVNGKVEKLQNVALSMQTEGRENTIDSRKNMLLLKADLEATLKTMAVELVAQREKARLRQATQDDGVVVPPARPASNGPGGAGLGGASLVNDGAHPPENA